MRSPFSTRDAGGLAKSAYDARRARAEDEHPMYTERQLKKLAQSPAVDGGSDDAWQYDASSTNSTVIDMSEPDIGYKYYRRIADDDAAESQQITVSFKQPVTPNNAPKFDGIGYYIFEGSGDTPVGDLGKDFTSPVVTIDILDSNNELREQGSYGLRLKSYYWFDYNDNDEVDEGEYVLSEPEEIRLIIDRTAPEVTND